MAENQHHDEPEQMAPAPPSVEVSADSQEQFLAVARAVLLEEPPPYSLTTAYQEIERRLREGQGG